MVSGVSSMGSSQYAAGATGGQENTASVSALKKSMNVEEQQMQSLLQGMEASNPPSQLAAQTSGLGTNINVSA
jgi:hypothetical protein